jgi:hypothetical protein
VFEILVVSGFSYIDDKPNVDVHDTAAIGFDSTIRNHSTKWVGGLIGRLFRAAKKQRKADAEAKVDAEADYERAPRGVVLSDSEEEGEDAEPIDALPVKTAEGELVFPKATVLKKAKPQHAKEGCCPTVSSGVFKCVNSIIRHNW